MVSDKRITHHIASWLKAYGVAHVVASSGSRNAPLVITLAGAEQFQLSTITDERSAGFQALGAAQMAAKPVAVCCTSGSAVANYYPAVLEAFYSKTPLIILTADRPRERIGKGEGQTCVQPQFFEPHIQASIHIEDGMDDETIASLLNLAGIQLAQEGGPVHINVALEEPLYGQVAELEVFEYEASEPFAMPMFLDEPEGEVLFVAAQMKPEDAQKVMDWNAANGAFPMYADPLSNLLGKAANIYPIELLFGQKLPKTVVTFGGQLVDKKLKQQLRSQGVDQHVHVDPFQDWDVLDADVDHLASFDKLGVLDSWTASAFQISKEAGEISDLPWSDSAAFQTLSKAISQDDVVHLGNGSVVRYAGYFPLAGAVYGNRGISGIDGSLSTAVGAAMADPSRQHWCIVGDQGFLYDSNALWQPALPKNLIVVVLNNGIGEIFNWLPGKEQVSPAAQHVFDAPQNVDLEKLCAAFGADYLCASSFAELGLALKGNNHCSIIEVKTQNAPNTATYKELKHQLYGH